MSDTLDVRYTDILNVEQTYKRNLDELKSKITILKNSIEAVVSDPNFTGATADSIKSYFSKISGYLRITSRYFSIKSSLYF